MNLSVGSSLTDVAVADFNRDGVADLAVADPYGLGGGVWILLGTGSGSFGVATHFPAALGHHELAVGDFNRDGSPDVAVTNWVASSVSILLGTGTGGLGSAMHIPLTPRPSRVATGDLDRDGSLDLVVILEDAGAHGELAVLLGTGTGSFGAAAVRALGRYTADLGIADLNGDGILDLAVAEDLPDTVSIFLGNGTGSFGPVNAFPAGYSPDRMAIGDVSGDGVPDLAVSNGHDVSVLLGTGMGRFAPPTHLTGVTPSAVVMGDLNGDGFLDLAASNGSSNDISILLGSGTGSFAAPVSFALGLRPYSVALADLNADGALDIVAVSAWGGASDISILLSRPPDTTPPSILCGTADGLWHAADVSIACIAADSGSGLANPADASFSLSTSVSAGLEDGNASTAMRFVCDQAGNCAVAGPITGNKIDRQPPSITISAPGNATYAFKSLQVASYACHDGGSGLANCRGTVASGAAIDTSSLGAHVFDVTASDAVGNTSTASVQYQVVATNWTQFRNGIRRTGVQPGEYVLDPTNVGGLRVDWAAATWNPIYSSPAVVDGVAYVGSTDGSLYAFSAVDGKALWSAAIGSFIFSSPAVSGGRVFIGSDDGRVYAFHALTGALLWTFATGGPVYSSPAVAGRIVYVGSTDQTVYALDAPTGRLIWAQPVGAPVWSSPTIDEGAVYVGAGDLLALDARTGRFRWSAGIPASIASTAATFDGLVFVGADDGNLYAVDRWGSMLWSAPTGGAITSSPATDGALVYVGSNDGNLYAFDVATGAYVWSTYLGGWVVSSPAYANGVVYVGSPGAVSAVEASSGALVWTHPLPSSFMASSPAVADATVYIGADDHNLYAFHR